MSGGPCRRITDRLIAARFPRLLLPAHPATFKVGWPPGPFISTNTDEQKTLWRDEDPEIRG